ncbi:MAG: T9SS type A sorting domain-containing protein, partial [Flavobacteriales bacterium]
GSGFQDVPEELCETEFVEPVFVLKNNGINTLTSATITYSYNNGADQVINWTGSLAQDDTENVDLNGFSAQFGENTIEVVVSSPNGQTDENANNNNSTSTFEVAVGEEFLTLSLETDNFGYETYWELRGPNNQVVASGGNTNVGPNGGGQETAGAGDPGAYANGTTITETIQIDGDGCYTFVIVDDYGDGICCNFFGNGGEYELRDGNNTIMAQGAEFGNSEEKTFGMVGGLAVNELDLGRVSVYPNPSSGNVYVEIEKTEAVETITITDLIGKTVYSQQFAGINRSVIQLAHLTNGIYNVNLVGKKGAVTKKLVLLKD